MKRKHVISGLLLVCFLATTVTMISSCKKKNDEPEKVLGCMDATALNFNALANEDDGSCIVPEAKQRAVFFDFTGTWCVYCGQWGIPRFEQVVTSKPNDVVPLGCHVSDEMSNTISEELDGIHNSDGGWPTLVVGNQPEATSVSTLLNYVTQTNSAAPVANAIATMTVSGSTITLKTLTKFFTATSGEYYLASYFLENGLLYSQEGITTPDPYTHEHVVRGVAGGSGHGELIASGSIAAGKVFNKDYSVPVGSGWTMANVYVALVIWKKSGTDWIFVNAWQSKAN
jgi:hypothetical protein